MSFLCIPRMSLFCFSSALPCPPLLLLHSYAETSPSHLQAHKASRKQSSWSGKESAQGCIPKRLLGRPDEALGGGNQDVDHQSMQLPSLWGKKCEDSGALEYTLPPFSALGVTPLSTEAAGFALWERLP